MGKVLRSIKKYGLTKGIGYAYQETPVERAQRLAKEREKVWEPRAKAAEDTGHTEGPQGVRTQLYMLEKREAEEREMRRKENLKKRREYTYK